ncbi:hypothetical protein THAOC_08508 [Thalassiosira oceanica]|uniref:Uncharacterized protein n=1 Tax=Thalassiosira oceanica TaxID=159749 RepID=K0T9T4_THAOC|nr:hypothetical protein THAOC_08508 [Thalassiosira oceanica]|eukprot:EJK70156.1 hypothetical protein THAOC_08508 [Thalassiosira oceanica]
MCKYPSSPPCLASRGDQLLLYLHSVLGAADPPYGIYIDWTSPKAGRTNSDVSTLSETKVASSFLWLPIAPGDDNG